MEKTDIRFDKNPKDFCIAIFRIFCYNIIKVAKYLAGRSFYYVKTGHRY